MTAQDDARTVRLALGVAAALLALRLYAAERIGFGDAEALYASYVLYPQAIYRDHPGLVGVLARAIGDGLPPTPVAAHRVTSVLSIAVPWIAALAARAMGATTGRAAVVALALLLVPETSVGLFALTPDLPLSLAWFTALGCAAIALGSPPTSMRALVATLAAGLAAGLAITSKASGVLLAVGLVATWGAHAERARLRTIAPWAAAGVALVVAAPAIAEEWARGLPMLRHRLIDTQHGAGPSLANFAKLVGGQLAYVGPPALVAAWIALRDLARHRDDDAASRLLFRTTVAASPLAVLAVVSPVAEPHWVAPMFLALPLHAARAETPLVGRRLRVAIAAFGAVALALVHVAVLTPVVPWVARGREPLRFDLTTDLWAWRDGVPLVEEQLAAAGEPAPIVVGPHWIVCAQLRAALPRTVIVACDGDAPADFADWVPRAAWTAAPDVLYVTDDRFDVDPAHALPDRAVIGIARVGVRRGGVTVRRISAWRLARSTRADLAAPPR